MPYALGDLLERGKKSKSLNRKGAIVLREMPEKFMIIRKKVWM
jgi:hypothetical protein